MAKHYDVAVLGTSIGALACAALLARRSWRVLVLGQGDKPAVYTHQGLPLARRSFTLLAAASPAFGRVLVELAQSQTFRRRTQELDPMLHALLPGRRLELPPDTTLFSREIDREFPEVRRIVDELYAELGRVNAAADATFERDVNWSPAGFWERRETGAALSALPRVDQPAFDLLGEFPRSHPFREIVQVTARFATDLAGSLPPLALARLHGAWTRGLVSLARGEDELVDFFLDRVRAHGGEVLTHGRADSIVTRSGKVTGVVTPGEDSPTGAQFIVTDRTTRELLDLAASFSPSRRTVDAMPTVVAARWRFVVSMLVRSAGVPRALARESFLLPEDSDHAVHLQRTTPTGCPKDHELLVAETLVHDDDPPQIRARTVTTVERFLPFVERHYLLVDSPHDGLPAWDYRSGKRESVDRALLQAGGGSLHAEPMVPLLAVEPTAQWGLSAEPCETPLRGAFVVGKSAFPALGQEGQLLAAWSAARVITRTDRRKEKMRREMWSKIQLG